MSVRNLDDTEIAEVSGALYGELVLFAALGTIGFLSYQIWIKKDEPLVLDEAALLYLSGGHCA